MDLTFSAEDEAFRQEVRQFLAEALPPNLARRVRLGQHLSKQETEAWQAALSARGWLAPHWPKDYGGQGW
ncbi:acyl-CoA dehydrogenase family protein, partial [Phenylobacterium sp.]|uniref:acyl-CoA dehydrogenase family protein n=1 Tax=Phenylobacterium sp. TaxID=1871053 RepID=UPI002ED96797